jgi:hypothetical protein
MTLPIHEGFLFNLAAFAAASGTSEIKSNAPGFRGLRVGVNISAFTGGTLTVTVFGRDVSNQTYTLLQSTALAATGFTELLIYPGASAASNLVANAPLPPSWGVNYSAASGTITATISYAYEN